MGGNNGESIDQFMLVASAKSMDIDGNAVSTDLGGAKKSSANIDGPMSPSLKPRARRNTRGIIKELLEEEHEEVDRSRRSARKTLSMSPNPKSRRHSIVSGNSNHTYDKTNANPMG